MLSSEKEINRIEWARHIETQEGSGLSQRKWCEANQVNHHNFRYWRQRLKREDTNINQAGMNKTTEDAERFDERAKVLVNHFDNIVVLDTVRANGTFTLGENIADQGGLQIAYTAFMKTPQAQSEEKIDGLTAAQRFFVSYANLWAGNIRDAEILRLTKIDPHSLGKWRVNGAVPHVGAWYEAFNIEPSHEMYIPVEERVSIW